MDFLEVEAIVLQMFEGKQVFNNQYQVEQYHPQLGGQSFTFTATSVATGEKLILKILYPKFTEERIDHELAMSREMDRLGSIFLVQCYWTEKFTIPIRGQEKPSGAIVMPKLPNKDIWKRVCRTPARHDPRLCGLDESQICVFGYDMIESLILLHRHNFAHNDVKPENFLLRLHDQHERVALCDYGRVKRVENGVVKRGTSPDLGTTAVDLWALGCTFFYMFTGNLAFTGTVAEQPAIKRGAFNEIIYEFTPSSVFHVLLARLICVSPTERITADDVRKHPFFGEIQAVKERLGMVLPDDTSYRPSHMD
jgi:serine/threonine protein kinase